MLIISYKAVLVNYILTSGSLEFQGMLGNVMSKAQQRQCKMMFTLLLKFKTTLR